MNKDVVILGGGPAGIITATTAKKNYPDKTVTIIRKEETGVIPCGIPYIFGTLDSVDQNVMGIDGPKKMGIEFIFDEIKQIDFDSKKLVSKNDTEIFYEKLIIATGSTPTFPPIQGTELNGVFTIKKDKNYLEKVYEYANNVEKVTVIGGGFIGVEVSDELRKMGKKVTLIEAMGHLLPAAYDEDFGDLAQETLESHDLTVKTNSLVKEISGSNKVEKIITKDGEEIKTDMVILATGYKANVELFKNTNLHIGHSSGIWVDEYMRTSIDDVFAVGDCVEHKDFFTRRPSNLMLASTAVFDARIAGTNLYHLVVVRENHGNLGVFSTSIEGLTLGAAGMTCKKSEKEGFKCVVGEAETVDRHPGTLPDKSKMKVKLLFSEESGILLGAQITGGKSVGEIINMIGLGLQKGITANDLVTMQIGTHPLLTSAPTKYPLITAAESALMKLRNYA